MVEGSNFEFVVLRLYMDDSSRGDALLLVFCKTFTPLMNARNENTYQALKYMADAYKPCRPVPRTDADNFERKAPKVACGPFNAKVCI